MARDSEAETQDEDDSDARKADASASKLPPFIVILHQFQGALDAVRQLHSELLPHVRRMEEERLSPQSLSAIRRLSPEKRELFEDFLRSRAEKASSGSVNEGAKATSDDISAPDNAATEESADSGSSDDQEEGALSKEDRETLRKVFGDSRQGFTEYMIRFQKTVLSPNRVDLLRGSFLTMAVSAFEVLLGGIVAQRFQIHPDTLPSERRFSLADLESFASIADARERLVEDQVDDFLRGSYDDWRQWFGKESGLNLNFASLCIDEKVLSEAFQRRHVLVHNAGRVSTRYLQRTEDPKPELGEMLRVDAEYLDRAIDEIDALGNLLLVGAWSKLLPDEESNALTELYLRAEDDLIANRWQPLRQISSIGKVQKVLPAEARQIFEVNWWLARKRIDGTEATRDEVKQWDTSALNPIYAFVKAALLDDLDQAFLMLPQLLEKEELTQRALEEWPVLMELRQDSRYAEYASPASAD